MIKWQVKTADYSHVIQFLVEKHGDVMDTGRKWAFVLPWLPIYAYNRMHSQHSSSPKLKWYGLAWEKRVYNCYSIHPKESRGVIDHIGAEGRLFHNPDEWGQYSRANTIIANTMASHVARMSSIILNIVSTDPYIPVWISTHIHF